MLTRLFALSALLALTPLVHADGDFARTLQVSGQPDLYVVDGSGSVRISPSTDNHLEIRAHVHAGWSLGGNSDVNARIQRILANPPITQSGNTIHIGDHEDPSLFKNISIDYELKVPASTALNLKSGSGDLEINQVGRFLAASTGSGSIRAHGLHGPAELQTGSGGLELDETAAGDVKAKSGSGSIRIRGLNGALDAVTGSGDVEALGHLDGPSRLTSGSGSLRLHLSPDSKFNLDTTTGSGTIRVHFPGAPRPPNPHPTTSKPPSTAAAPPSNSTPAPETSKSPPIKPGPPPAGAMVAGTMA